MLNKYGSDYKVIFVGDATMSPYEVTEAGGSVEHWNEESGIVWMNRLREHFSNLVWLNPEPVDRWRQIVSTQVIWRLLEGQMYPMTLDGLDKAMDSLRKSSSNNSSRI
mgnify:FL=1